MDRQHEWVLPQRPTESRWTSAWSCPRCRVYARQNWRDLYRKDGYTDDAPYALYPDFAVSTCSHCEHVMVWFGDAILFPPTTTVPAPHKEMPSPASETYLEAAGIVDASPRAAAALVRLALEELCLALGVEGGLNDAIKALVKRGMRSDVQKALDVVRVSGNRAIHPGTIDTSDTREIATAMFALLNMIVDDQIARPKELAAMYEALPEAVKGQIQRRDGRTAEKDAKSSGSTGSSETV